jgi:hypothetical protein
VVAVFGNRVAYAITTTHDAAEIVESPRSPSKVIDLVPLVRRTRGAADDDTSRGENITHALDPAP